MNYSFSGTYTNILKKLLDKLEAVNELRIDYEDEYQGHVDVDILLKDGRIFSYKYSYSSLGAQSEFYNGNYGDDWEERRLNDDEIFEEMKKDATYFDNMEQYNTWRKMCNSN